MSAPWWTRHIDEPVVPHVSMPRRIFVDRGVLTIPPGTFSRDAVFAALDALADGKSFMVQDNRRPSHSPR